MSAYNKGQNHSVGSSLSLCVKTRWTHQIRTCHERFSFCEFSAILISCRPFGEHQNGRISSEIACSYSPLTFPRPLCSNMYIIVNRECLSSRFSAVWFGLMSPHADGKSFHFSQNMTKWFEERDDCHWWSSTVLPIDIVGLSSLFLTYQRSKHGSVLWRSRYCSESLVENLFDRFPISRRFHANEIDELVEFLLDDQRCRGSKEQNGQKPEEGFVKHDDMTRRRSIPPSTPSMSIGIMKEKRECDRLVCWVWLIFHTFEKDEHQVLYLWWIFMTSRSKQSGYLHHLCTDRIISSAITMRHLERVRTWTWDRTEVRVLDEVSDR